MGLELKTLLCEFNYGGIGGGFLSFNNGTVN